MLRITWKGDPFADMTELEKEIFNLGMNLMGMPEDHPHYKRDTHHLRRLMREWDKCQAQ